MKTLKIIVSLSILLLFSCQSKQKIDTDFLIGKWQTSNSNYTTLFGKPFSSNATNTTTLEFIKERLHIDDVDTGNYKFIVKDSSVVLHYKKEVEVISLHILNENEFETSDNMGLTLQFKRIK